MAEDFYNWDKHWSVYDANAQTNPAHLFRLKLISEMIQSLPGDRLVDIGCGQGDLLCHINSRHPSFSLFGFELSASGVASTKRKVPSADVRELDLFSESASIELSAISADIATCSEVLEHVPDPVEFLRRSRAALVPGGHMVATVPGGPRTGFDIQIGHFRHFTHLTAMETFELAGFDVVAVRCAGFPFFNLYKLAVLVRGAKVAEDFEGKTSFAFRISMKIFATLFKLNVNKSKFGWQITVIARNPGGTNL
jgi:ubiquinone/menaquinone biosynthesis C-methylase UbiE